jgi:hypothetical protein
VRLVPPGGEERHRRRLQMLRAAAPVPYLAVPVDLILADWVSRTAERKDDCGAALPGYQTALANLVPLVFALLALACSVAGTVVLVRGRRHRIHDERIAGRTAVVLSVPAVLVAVIFAVPAWFAVGFSTWCF